MYRSTAARFLGSAGISLGLLLAAVPALAQDASTGQLDVYAAGKEAPEDVYVDRLDGTLSGEGDLDDDYAPKSGTFRLPTLLGPWMAFKQGLAEDYGLRFGGSYGVLWQNYSDTLIDQYNAVGGKFTFNVSYDLFHRNAPDALTFDMVVEQRGPLGTDLPPLWAGFGTGSITATAATWGEFDLGITQAYLRQNLFDNRFQYAVGKLFAPNYIDAYPFFDDNRQFLNQSFATSPTIPVPLRGFGLVGAAYPVRDTGIYVQGGMFTTNSSDTGSTIRDFFTKNEHFYSLEVGWSGLAGTGAPLQARGPTDANNFHITGWYRNELENGSPEAYGAALNANFTVSDNYLLFFRGGWSHGWVINENFTTGIGWRPPGADSDLLGFGAGWAHPDNELFQEQYTLEAFYRYMLTPNLALTPDAQLIVNPALNPTKDSIWVVSFRTRATF